MPTGTRVSGDDIANLEGDFSAARQYIAEGIVLSQGEHTYLFVVSDGTYTVTLSSDGWAHGYAEGVPFNGPSVISGNRAPIVDLSPLGGGFTIEVGEFIHFSIFSAYDPDDDINGNGRIDQDEVDNLVYLWDFGDGSTSMQRDPQHTFTALETSR